MSVRADRLLVVDRDESFRRALADELRALWPALRIDDAGPEDLPRVATAPGLALCGIGDDQDREWLDRLRKTWPDLTVIVLLGPVAQQDEAERPLGVDWLPKPVRLGDLVAMIDRVGGRNAPRRGGGRLLPVGGFEFDAAAKLLRRGERQVRLTEKEAALLEYLARADGAVPRDELLARVWGYNAAADTHTLETLVYRLRRKIEAEPTRAALLVTEGGGYRLVR